MDAFSGMFEPEAWTRMLEVMLKMGIGAVLGGLIGWERERHNRPAGIRTHMMTVIGVVLFSEVSKVFANGDPSRIAAQIVTGVGFLGAGTIMRQGPEIRGLTTAASLWAAAAIGMAVSAGGAFLLVAAFSTALALFTLSFVDRIEQRVNPGGHGSTMVATLESGENVSALLEALTRVGASISGVRSETVDGGERVYLGLTGDREGLSQAATNCPGVRVIEWRHNGG